MNGTPAGSIALAQARRLAGDFPEALRILDPAIETWPGDAALRATRAVVFLDRGETDRAREDAERALEIDPRCAEAWLVRARLHPEADVARAIEDAGRAIDLDPANVAARVSRGHWRWGAGDRTGAGEDYTAATACAAVDPRSLYYRGLARVALGDDAGAANDLAAAAGQGMSVGNVRWRLAEAKLRLGDGAGAIAEFDRALEAAPGSFALHFARGRAKLGGGDPAGALADFTRATELDPASVAARCLRAQAWSREIDARADYERAAAMDARDALEVYHRGIAKEALGRPADAARDHEQALQASPGPELRPWIEQALRRTRKVSVLERLRASPATSLLLGISVAVFVVQGSPFANVPVDVLLARGAVERYHVWGGQYWRLLTSAFLHIGLIHLAWNVINGFSWSSEVERRLGPARTVAAYLLTGVGASAVSVLGHRVVAAGSSGALFGMIGLLLALWHRQMGSWKAFLGDPVVRSNLKMVAIWFAIGLALPMDNFAHAGGLAFGVLLGWPLAPPPGSSRARRAAVWTGGLAILGAVVVAACRPGADPAWRAAIVLERGQRALEEGRHPEAEALFDEAIRARDMPAGVYLGRGLARHEQGDAEGAKQDFREALHRDPRLPEAHAALGGVLADLGDHRGAAAALAEAIRLRPDVPDWRFVRGHSLAKLGEIDEARRELSEALRIAPADWERRTEARVELERLR